MSAPQLSWSERLIASAAASPFKPIDIGRVIRRTIWSIAVCAVLIAAARELHGWLAIAMWVLVALRVLPYAFTGLVQSVADERTARLDRLGPVERHIMTTTTQLARHFGTAA